MKLLVVTQKVDINDDILGFFHRWIEEFGKRAEKVTVICLEKGEYHFPQNIEVLSLGKELGKSRLKYIFRFYKYIWQKRRSYDTVFVHMNQEYVILGGLFWKLLSKKIFMWRNHPIGNVFTNIAVFLSDKVFCTSKFSYTADFKKSCFMPVGIDTEKFKRDPNIQPSRDVLFLARMSPVKRPDVLIEAIHILAKKNVNISATFYGNPTPKDQDYYQSIKNKVIAYGLDKKILFKEGISNDKTIKIYNKHDIFVNLSPNGMYDKTIFEAASCGTRILVSNKNLIGEIDGKFIFKENDTEDLANKLYNLTKDSSEEKNKSGIVLTDYVQKKHSLKKLGEMLVNELA